MRRPIVRLAAFAVVVLAAVGVSHVVPAQPKVAEVLIGSVLPLTGNFASLGQQYHWAAQTAEDIVNNDYPDLQVPLGPGKGFPGLGGALMKLIVRDDLCTRPAVLHGGALMSLADTLGAVATVANLPQGMTTTTIESDGSRRSMRMPSMAPSRRARSPGRRARGGRP